MISIKKTIAFILICFHGIIHTNNDDILYGIFLTGITVTGIVIAGKIAHESNLQAQKELVKNCTIAQSLLQKTDKYLQINTSYNQQRAQEKFLENIYLQLRTASCNNIDNIIISLEKDIKELKAVQKNISSLFLQNNDQSNLQKNISLRVETCGSLLTIIKEHISYFKLCDIHNNYTGMPTYQSKIIEWVAIGSLNSLYPLLDYKEKAVHDITYIDTNNGTLWPEITQKIQHTKKEIQRSLAAVHASGNIIIEAQNKKQNEIRQTEIQAIHDKNNIALRAVKAQEQIARDQAEIARASKNRTAEIAQQNYLLARQYPIDQEKNRIQAERNRLDAEKNRLLSERNRIDLIIAENRRREIAALETQNRLQAERNQRERQHHNPSNVYTQANVNPSAPPAENYSINIPLARPYTSENIPEATAVYKK